MVAVAILGGAIASLHATSRNTKDYVLKKALKWIRSIIYCTYNNHNNLYLLRSYPSYI